MRTVHICEFDHSHDTIWLQNFPDICIKSRLTIGSFCITFSLTRDTFKVNDVSEEILMKWETESFITTIKSTLKALQDELDIFVIISEHVAIAARCRVIYLLSMTNLFSEKQLQAMYKIT